MSAINGTLGWLSVSGIGNDAVAGAAPHVADPIKDCLSAKQLAELITLCKSVKLTNNAPCLAALEKLSAPLFDAYLDRRSAKEVARLVGEGIALHRAAYWLAQAHGWSTHLVNASAQLFARHCRIPVASRFGAILEPYRHPEAWDLMSVPVTEVAAVLEQVCKIALQVGKPVNRATFAAELRRMGLGRAALDLVGPKPWQRSTPAR